MEIRIADEVTAALADRRPVVALESTVIAHGLPHPVNVETALKCSSAVRVGGCVPATIAVFDGVAHIGLTPDQIERLAAADNVRKISTRDLAVAASRRLTCATTVSTTMFFAHRAGIEIFATGGIGGVHRGFDADVSADLPALAKIPMTVVCSGPKIILDLDRTREWLETNGVTVAGWQCDEMPAFYSPTSGLPIDDRLNDAAEAARLIQSRNEIGLKSSVLVTVPCPADAHIARDEMESIVAEALRLAEEEDVAGKAITPFLLSEMSRATAGRTLAANVALLKNNARVASQIAVALTT